MRARMLRGMVANSSVTFWVIRTMAINAPYLVLTKMSSYRTIWTMAKIAPRSVSDNVGQASIKQANSLFRFITMLAASTLASMFVRKSLYSHGLYILSYALRKHRSTDLATVASGVFSPVKKRFPLISLAIVSASYPLLQVQPSPSHFAIGHGVYPTKRLDR
ncbi:MAG: hypothetical protein M0Z50_09060 [Planctomycetia bacterium]|nr:hypothetical protein [Planctomycetia bacterium]